MINMNCANIIRKIQKLSLYDDYQHLYINKVIGYSAAKKTLTFGNSFRLNSVFKTNPELL